MCRINIKIHPDDTVVTVLDTKTELTRLAGDLPCNQGIPFGHKAAVTAMCQGEDVVKYGVRIGVAKVDIRPGEHVHVHNVE